MSKYGEGMLYWVEVKVSGTNTMLELVEGPVVANLVQPLFLSFVLYVLWFNAMAMLVRKTTRDMYEENWSDEEEVDEKPSFKMPSDSESDDAEGDLLFY